MMHSLQVVHYGYLKAWRSVQTATEKVVRQVSSHDSTSTVSDWTTFFTGHSLGGALATLAAASAVAQGCENLQCSFDSK